MVQRGTGRPRRYCRRACRQRAYESRALAAELGLDDTKLIVDRRRYEQIIDQRHLLAQACDDIERAAPTTDPVELAERLEWLLDHVRPAADA